MAIGLAIPTHMSNKGACNPVYLSFALNPLSRPLRSEFAGGLYHATWRGDRREAIYRDDTDRKDWLAVLGAACRRLNWRWHAYCWMTHPYHFVVETPDAAMYFCDMNCATYEENACESFHLSPIAGTVQFL
jgi:hypothetical protein